MNEPKAYAMKKLIPVFMLFFCWGCLLEDSPPDNQFLHSSLFFYDGENTTGIALLQILKQQTLPQENTLKFLENQEEMLYDYATLQTGPVFGMYYLIPVRNKVSQQVEKAFVYKVIDETTGQVTTFRPVISEVLVLDEQELNRIPAHQRFLYSYPFKEWEEQGVKVAEGLTDFAKKLDGKWHHLESHELPAPLTRVPVGSFVTIHYELHVNNDVSEDGTICVYGIPSYAADSIFLSNQHVLEACLEEQISFYFDIRSFTIRLESGDLTTNPNLDMAISNFMAVNDISFQNTYPFYHAITWEITSTSSDPGERNNNSGGSSSGGSSGGGGSSSNSGGNSGSKPSIDLTDVNNFVGINISNNCWVGCTLIMQNYGIPHGSRSYVYRLLAEDETTGELYHYGDNPIENYTKAIACIDRHLDAGCPIEVGVNHTPKRKINDDNVTDHFIVITGRGYDHDLNQYYYIYMETGRSQVNANAGCDIVANRLYYDPVRLIFQDPIAGAKNNRKYDVSQVRPNDGINLEETESY